MAERNKPKTKIFNDPVHGHIEIPALCVKIIDTPHFQRLRNIKQLGGNCFVYPGAVHTRFEHSLGVCYLAGEMMKHLRDEQKDLEIEDRDILLVQIAGLCHDLGHGPFSHLYDGMFMPEVDKSGWTHEEGTETMLRDLTKMKNLISRRGDYDHLTEEEVKFIIDLIRGPDKDENYRAVGKYTKDKHFMYQIVANKESGIDVDKWDYFIRDCYHLGITSMFDHRRLLKLSRVIKIKQEGDDDKGKGKDIDKNMICFRDKEAINIYNMFHTRQMLHRQAYQHKTCYAVQAMIRDALIAANEKLEKTGEDGSKKSLAECRHDPVAYIQLTDNIYQEILCSKDNALKDARTILERIQKRDLYRCVGQAKAEPGISSKNIDTLYEELIRMYCAELNDTEEEIEESHKGNKRRKGKDGNQRAKKKTRVGSPKPKGLALNHTEVKKYLKKPEKVKFDYGSGTDDPVKRVWFYTKDNMNQAIRIPKDKVSIMLPHDFQEIYIRWYTTSTDDETFETARKCFKKRCEHKCFDLIEPK